jgi:hypothetical protein
MMPKFLASVVLLAVAASAQTWTVTSRGPQCGGELRGQVVQAPQGSGLRLGVLNAAPSSLAILAIGMPQATPVALPGSNCELYVDPRGSMLDLTDAQGRASFALRLPAARVPVTFYLQAVVVEARRPGRIATSTNVLQVVGS